MFQDEEEKKPKNNILGLLRPQSDLNDKSQSAFFSEKIDSEDTSFVVAEKKENPMLAALKSKVTEKVHDAKNECACAHDDSKD